jgi:hypothetical protein
MVRKQRTHAQAWTPAEHAYILAQQIMQDQLPGWMNWVEVYKDYLPQFPDRRSKKPGVLQGNRATSSQICRLKGRGWEQEYIEARNLIQQNGGATGFIRQVDTGQFIQTPPAVRDFVAVVDGGLNQGQTQVQTQVQAQVQTQGHNQGQAGDKGENDDVDEEFDYMPPPDDPDTNKFLRYFASSRPHGPSDESYRFWMEQLCNSDDPVHRHKARVIMGCASTEPAYEMEF